MSTWDRQEIIPAIVSAVGQRKSEKQLVMIKELPLDQSYVAIADAILKLEPQHDIVIVDAGGVGRPVLDMLKAKASRAWGLALTASGKGKIDRSRRMMTIAKVNLVHGLYLHMADQLIKLSPDLERKDALTWLHQMKAFQSRDSKGKHVKYEAETGTA